MDTNTNTAFLRGGFAPRDHSSARRVYLDTYARRRTGLSDEQLAAKAQAEALQSQPQPVESIEPSAPASFMTEQPPVVAPIAQPQIAPVQTVAQQSTVVAVPIATAPQAVQPSRPVVQNFTYTPQAQPVSVQPAKTHKTYLDTLTYRHQQAVAQAPAQEETIFQPVLSETTQSLLEDTETERRIEANLRALYEDNSLTHQIAKNTVSASAAHVRTIVGSALACGVLAMGIFSFTANYDTQPVVAIPIGAPVIEVEAPASQPTGGTPINQANEGAPAVDPSHPVRLVASSIGVNAPVEGLGTTPEGLIAVPKAYGVVGWYNKGAVPGKKGPAVLVGHYAGGNGAVFDKLQDLKNGDLVTTTNGRGQSFTYRVIAMTEYAKDAVPMAQIFKSSDESRLEIITCAGKWQAKTYDKRLVVTAELVK